MQNIIKFEESKFSTSYSFESPRKIVRILSDAFSKQNCDVNGAIKYAALNTQGCCIYCGKKMYLLKNGAPLFTNEIHYDHIYPASKMNLFEVGNVALACESCNLSKSDRNPLDYYDIRASEDKPLFIEEREEFELFLNKFTEPYKKKWPKHYDVGTREIEDDLLFKQYLTELLYDEVEISRSSGKYNHEHSVNKEIWGLMIERASEIYSEYSVKDVAARVGYTNSMFEGIFGHSAKIEDISHKDLYSFFRELLESKANSKNEIQKYRMLIRVLIDVLDKKMNGMLDGLFESLPTFKEL